MLRDTVAQWDEGSSTRAVLETLGQMVADAAEVFEAPLRRYIGLGALEMTPVHIRLARSAYFVSDTVLADSVAAGLPG